MLEMATTKPPWSQYEGVSKNWIRIVEDNAFFFQIY